MKPSINSREARPAAAEVKFLLDASTAEQARDWMRCHLPPDAYGGGPFGDTYRTSTLYYDSEARDVFHRRGSQGRAKFRVRRYGDGREVFFERKLRRPRLLVKWRTRVGLDTLDRLARSTLAPHDAGYWFQRRLVGRQLAPACQVRYRRVARVGTAEGTLVRVTLDDEIEAWGPAGFISPPADPGVRVVAPGQVLELKYAGYPPALLRRLIGDLGLSPVSMSKYRLATTALGASDDTGPEERGRRTSPLCLSS